MRVHRFWFCLSSDEVIVRTQAAHLGSMEGDVGPEHCTGDLNHGGSDCEAFQDVAKSHSEVCQDCALGSWCVRLAEELQRHLSIGLDHGFHGCLLGGVCHRVNVNAICSIVGLCVMGWDENRLLEIRRKYRVLQKKKSLQQAGALCCIAVKLLCDGAVLIIKVNSCRVAVGIWTSILEVMLQGFDKIPIPH